MKVVALKSAFLLAVAVFLFSGAISGYAEAAAPKTQGLTGIQSQLNQANETIEQLNLKRENLLAQLQKIEQQYGAAAGSLHDLGLEIGGKQQRLKKLDTEMKKQQAELKLQSDELSKQVRASFVMGKKEQLRLLLNQQDPTSASRMMVYYDYLNKNRLNKLAVLKSNIARLAKLEQEKRNETDLLGRAVRSHQSVKIGLGNTQKQRELLLAKLTETFKKKSQQLEQLEESAIESQALIDKLQQAALEREKIEALNPKKITSNQSDTFDSDGNPVKISVATEDKSTVFEVDSGKAFAELKGHLPLPVTGTVVRKFGSQRAVTRWDGILISANEGTDIRAVSAGRVVFANWLRGYGLLIILDHGQGYLSLYAFNQSLYKKVADQVTAGTVIAAVGKSGGREESGVYFGIRSKGKPVDPLLWCKKR